MRSRKSRAIPARLEAGRRRFEQWRRTRKGHARIPESLWTSAVKLADAYGLCRTAQTLRLDYNALKRRVESAGVKPVRSGRTDAQTEDGGRRSRSNAEEVRTGPGDRRSWSCLFWNVAGRRRASSNWTIRAERRCGSASPAARAAGGGGGAEPGFPRRIEVMIQVTPQMRILVAVEPADFRKGIDGLARVCKEELQRDPFCGCGICVPQPAGHGREGVGVRWPGVLAMS